MLPEYEDESVSPTWDTGRWRKSIRSAAAGECVEIAEGQGVVAVRDSKNPDGPVLRFGMDEFREFIHAVRDGAFDIR